MIAKVRWGLFVFFAVNASHAAPPVDFTRSDANSPRGAAKKAKPQDSDFEMLDVNDPQPDFERDAVGILFDVMGRTRPSRDGRPILRCIKFDRVRFLKFSADKKWAAVQSLRSGRRAWVPISAIEQKAIKKINR